MRVATVVYHQRSGNRQSSTIKKLASRRVNREIFVFEILVKGKDQFKENNASENINLDSSLNRDNTVVQWKTGQQECLPNLLIEVTGNSIENVLISELQTPNCDEMTSVISNGVYPTLVCHFKLFR